MCTKHLSMLIWRTNALADAHSVSATIPIRSAVQIHSGTSMIRVWRILKAVDDFDFTGYKELVFCGYGEPTSALDNMLETAKYVKGKASRHQTQTQHKRSFWQNQQQAHSWVDFKVYWFCFNQPQYLFIGKVWRSLPSCFWPCVWVNAQICRGCKEIFWTYAVFNRRYNPRGGHQGLSENCRWQGIYLKIRKYSD